MILASSNTPRPPVTAKKLPAPPTAEEDTGPVAKVTSWVGIGAQGMAGLPRLLDKHGWVTEALSIHDQLPLIRDAAAGAGILGTVSLVSNGAMQIHDGAKRKNSAEILAGASEVARGLYVGAWTGGWEIGPFSNAGDDLHSLSNSLSFVSGGLMVAAGLCRMTHSKPDDTPINPRVVGAIEAGMGATWVAAFVGVHPLICLGARCGLGAAKALYIHADKLEHWKDRAFAPTKN